MMNARLSILIIVSFIISGCAKAATPTPVTAPILPTLSTALETASVATSIPPIETSTPVVIVVTATPQLTDTVEPTPTSGMIMEIVSDVSPTSVPQSQLCQHPRNWVLYTVQLNDTLSSLGQRTGVNWQQIQVANCLSGVAIFAGQRLYLPSVPAQPLPGSRGPTLTVQAPQPPAPGNPRVSVKPARGVIPTIYTFEIRDFAASEFVTVKIWPVGATVALASFQVMIGADGNLDFPWISQVGNPTGNYFVVVANDDESHKAVGEFVVE